MAGKQRKRKYKKREPEKERETNRKRKIAGRHFGVINAISISLSKYGATLDYSIEPAIDIDFLRGIDIGIDVDFSDIGTIDIGIDIDFLAFGKLTLALTLTFLKVQCQWG